ncbi:MAG: DNA replication/repair protein RecF [Clostridia bacterium]|nr:DNA replication/repair protein RecF [Clostridia bacterium]
MKIEKLRLIDFRNYENSIIEFKDGFNVIYGENAAGKTNILEAIFYFASGKSFRGCKDRELIRFEKESASVDMRFSRGNENGTDSETKTEEIKKHLDSVHMGLKLYKGKKKVFERDNNVISRLSEYLGAFRAVIFTPDHLSLIKGHPENRRRFIDLAISQSYPRYVAYLNEYNRLLMQKNALLRKDFDNSNKRAMLEVYNERMAVSAGAISFNRKRFVSLLEKEAKKIHFDISGCKEELSIEYLTQSGTDCESAEETKERLKEFYLSKTDLEIQRGMTLFGVHKDDLNFYINGRNAKLYASQGQQRSAVLSLKIAEGQISKNVTGEYPVFLLDDILSELDDGRKEAILEKTYGKQVIITGCEQEYFEGLEINNKIFVEKGACKSCI